MKIQLRKKLKRIFLYNQLVDWLSLQVKMSVGLLLCVFALPPSLRPEKCQLLTEDGQAGICGC